MRTIKDYIVETIYNGPKNIILRSMDKPQGPKWIWFGVTDRCNSRCVHCNIWKAPKTSNLITLEEIEKTFSDPLLNNLETVILSGGEVVLRDDTNELIGIINKYCPKAQIILSTNGLLPDRVLDTTRFAISNNIPFGVGISLDGIGEKHDLVRGVKGNFEKTDYLLKELVKIRDEFGCGKLGLTIGLTLSDFALPSVKEVENYAKKLNVDFLVQWYSTSSYYDNENDNIATKKQEMSKIVDELPHTPVNEMWFKWLKTGKFEKFSCYGMYSFCVLQWDGSISPCLGLWGEVAGNVKQNTFSEIWTSKRANEVRKTVKNCKGCLNSWGVGWSFTSAFFPTLFANLKHPKTLLKKLRGEYYIEK